MVDEACMALMDLVLTTEQQMVDEEQMVLTEDLIT